MRHLSQFLLALFVALVMLPQTSFGHAGGHGKGRLHSWHLRDGKLLRGSLHSFRSESVIIEDGRGKLHVVAMTGLSDNDQAYADARFLAIASLHPAPAPPNAPTLRTEPLPSEHPSPYTYMGLALALLGISAAYVMIPRQRRALGYSMAVLVAAASVVSVPSSYAFVREVLAGTSPERIDSSFVPFKPLVKTRWDNTYFYVESNGMPSEMPAMKGITAWQQQVPIPQPYFGNNAWSIPLNPVVAEVPVSPDTALHTGAIAIGANGVPVFNPENNRGEFSQDIGELDAFGGHCGRADDYHYHIAPTHLAKVLGPSLPIAWGLDGYPLFGYTEPDGSPVTALDKYLGHEWHGDYHYHAINKKPYLMAIVRGKITIQNDQIMPQPRASSVRPFLQALKGATITDLRKCDTSHYALRYTLNGKTHWVNYRWDSTKKFTYVFVKPDTARRTETYQRK